MTNIKKKLVIIQNMISSIYVITSEVRKVFLSMRNMSKKMPISIPLIIKTNIEYNCANIPFSKLSPSIIKYFTAVMDKELNDFMDAYLKIENKSQNYE